MRAVRRRKEKLLHFPPLLLTLAFSPPFSNSDSNQAQREHQRHAAIGRATCAKADERGGNCCGTEERKKNCCYGFCYLWPIGPCNWVRIDPSLLGLVIYNLGSGNNWVLQACSIGKS
ncbi:hypothetical protein ES332_D02G157500v1 [Gossypium tomentosum]|uniref:Uncharacterized protein n=1 Tax=Gossypium tomentosum TaxID=34277 RepID=A0A5D2LXN1_GOSTO|nr:hypothetical protein ES332_D02G157500v1 [Gossypium tomentosum]